MENEKYIQNFGWEVPKGSTSNTIKEYIHTVHTNRVYNTDEEEIRND
jgi:hypothetical protein